MFTLPELPFEKSSMPDFCSEETFDYHYGKHHAGYITKLNAAIENTEFANMELADIIRISHSTENLVIFNNAAQHFNHSFFWESLSAESQTPSETLLEKINASFGSFEKFKEEFSTKAGALFGSGWTWLVADGDTLSIVQTHNADTPQTDGKTPLLTLDVWEHAYYIDHRNARPDFIAKFWNHVNWEKVEERLKM